MATSWNITLKNTSPVFTYYPYYDGFGLTNGWQVWFSETGYNTGPAELGVGISAHITSLAGANVTLSFYGTGIELYGTANCTFDVSMDGVFSSTLTSSNDVLYGVQSLSQGAHTLTLTARPTTGQQLAFENAVIYISQATPQMESYSNADTTFFNYAGNWSTGTDTHVPGGTYHYTETMGSTVSTSFKGSSAVVVQGIVNWGHWEYTVSLNGSKSVLNASSYWFIPDTTLFYEGGLDPTQTYVLNITDTSEDGNKLSVNSVDLYQPSSLSTPSKSSNTGTIAGSVVGATLFLALAIGFVFWRRNRRPAALRSGRDSDVLLHETTPQAHTTYFPSVLSARPISGTKTRERAKNYPSTPIGGNPDDLRHHREREIAHGASITSPLGSYSEPRNVTSGSRSSLSMRVRRPLPPPPGDDPSSLVSPQADAYLPSPLIQDVQISDSDVNRIIEIIASRIDAPEENSNDPPPYRH